MEDINETEYECQCGATKNLFWDCDPYHSSIYGEDIWGWWCPICYQIACDSI